MKKLSQRSVAIDKKKESNCEILASTLKYAWTILLASVLTLTRTTQYHTIFTRYTSYVLLDLQASHY